MKSARVTGPLAYLSPGGDVLAVPLGPCLVETRGPSHAEVIWGDSGEHCALLAPQALRMAQLSGHIVFLNPGC